MSSTDKDQDRDEGAADEGPAAVRRPRLQNEGGTVDDHGRRPGSPSRTGTGAQRPADAERVRRANEGPRLSEEVRTRGRRQG